MPRGYRLFIAALVGWLILAGASPPNNGNVNANARAEIRPSSTPTVEHSPQAGGHAQPCDQPSNDTDPNLCAAVRAAVAAEEQANRAWWANLIGAIIAPLSFISIWIAAYALRQTNKSLRLAHKDRVAATRRAIANAKDTGEALRHAEASANAAAAQVEITESTATRQLRAYITAVSAHAEIWRERDLTNVKLEIILHNSGSTTAIIDHKKAKFQNQGWKCSSESRDKTIISPRSSESVIIQCGSGGSIPTLNMIARMFVEYRDYLGKIHTEDSFWTCGPDFPTPSVRTDYAFICHSKIDESIGRFIDPAGEEAEEARIAETVQRAMATIPAGAQHPSNGG